MVAYSFKSRFADPIDAGTKMFTIRADRKRHARAGEDLQLYTGMRTKHCRLIARKQCKAVFDVRLVFEKNPKRDKIYLNGIKLLSCPLDDFARMDGFADWAELRAFWQAEHPTIFGSTTAAAFSGKLILWAVWKL